MAIQAVHKEVDPFGILTSQTHVQVAWLMHAIANRSPDRCAIQAVALIARLGRLRTGTDVL